MDVANRVLDLGVSQNHPILRLAARYVSEVEDPNHWTKEASITIDKWTVQGY